MIRELGSDRLGREICLVSRFKLSESKEIEKAAALGSNVKK